MHQTLVITSAMEDQIYALASNPRLERRNLTRAPSLSHYFISRIYRKTNVNITIFIDTFLLYFLL